MKQFIWLLCGIFLSGLLLGTLSACGDMHAIMVMTNPSSANQEDTTPADKGESGSAPAESEAGTEEPVSGSAANSAAEDEARRLAYGEILWDAYLLGVLPDGTELERMADLGPAEGNEFALADVDGDEAEELVLYWTEACMAGQVCLVYGYDGEEARLELSEFPALTFYDNGTAKADWSHNQGLAGRFWPFYAYRYEPESGVYQCVGGVDAWDSDYDSNIFPYDIDADGDGLVYYLLPADWDGQYGMGPVDGVDYENWWNARMGDAEEIEVPWQELTEENIAALGAPKPDVEYPEPLG